MMGLLFLLSAMAIAVIALATLSAFLFVVYVERRRVNRVSDRTRLKYAEKEIV